MSATMTMTAEGPVFQVQLEPPQSRHPKLDREYEAFLDLLPDLLKTHKDRYVAIHDGAVIADGVDILSAAKAAYPIAGDQPILIRQVTLRPREPVRILSPRVEASPLIRAVMLDQ
jgi:hypothetical protein